MEKRFFQEMAEKVADIFIQREVGKKLELLKESQRLFKVKGAVLCSRCNTPFLMSEGGESCPCDHCATTWWCMRDCCVGDPILKCSLCRVKYCSLVKCSEPNCSSGALCLYCINKCDECDVFICHDHVTHVYRDLCNSCLASDYPEHKKVKK